MREKITASLECRHGNSRSNEADFDIARFRIATVKRESPQYFPVLSAVD